MTTRELLDDEHPIAKATLAALASLKGAQVIHGMSNGDTLTAGIHACAQYLVMNFDSDSWDENVGEIMKDFPGLVDTYRHHLVGIPDEDMGRA